MENKTMLTSLILIYQASCMTKRWAIRLQNAGLFWSIALLIMLADDAAMLAMTVC